MPLRADRFKDYRVRRGYSQEELAQELGTSTRQINRYETGINDPAGDIVAKASKLFGVTTDYLLGVTDDPSGKLSQDDLSPAEKLLIEALRDGRIVEAMEAQAALVKSYQKPNVSSMKPATNG